MSETANYEVLSGGGESGALMRAVEWASTAVGPVASWPQSLRTALSILLDTSFGMAVAWGPEYVFFYNDAYRPILGSTKHPGAMGRRISEIFPEIWHIIGPMFDDVMRGKTFGWDNWRLPLDRHGFTEECFFTFSYSPIRDESGGVGGVLVTVAEITARVLGERRMRVLRDLAARTAEARNDDEACRVAASAMDKEPWDLPFALIYLLDGEEDTARLAGKTGEIDAMFAPSVIAPSEDFPAWPIADVVRHGTSVMIDDLDRLGIMRRDDFGGSLIRQAAVLPIVRHGDSRLAGVLIAGISPRLKFDAQYHDFLDLLSNQIATAVANARAFQEAKARADALAELDRAKTLFFSNISHEFRTPLTLLLGPIEDLLKGDLAEEADREALQIAHRNALRLLKLVNTLLEFSRIEAGRIEASYEPTDLASFTAELAAVFRSAIEKAGLTFVIRCEPLAEPAYVDREMWEKIVLNLISNAFKFTFEGTIEVTLRAVDGEIEFRVQDTGVGIPEAEMPNIFQRFHRVRGARSRSNEGTGIGLALVQELVRLHGGRVGVKSDENRGSTFSVYIPSGTAHLPADRISAPRTLTPVSIGPQPFLNECDQWLPRQTRRSPGRATADDSARVLVVEDNADMREYLCHLLADRWEVDSATDGVVALERIRDRRPDLVLADIMMPEMGGFELLRRIRRDEALRDVPVILLSARAGEEAKVEGLDAGADDYLVKPFSAAELIARIGSHLNLAKIRQQSMRRERQLGEEIARANERTTRILNSITDAFAFVDRDWVIRMVNPKAEEVVSVSASELIGHTVWEKFPDVIGTPFETAYRKAMGERQPQRVEAYFAPLGKWIEVDVYPSEDGLAFFFRDVTDRVLSAERLRESESRYRKLAHELEIANRAKDEFLTTLSHELRTPMTATVGWAALLRMGAFKEMEWRQAVEAIEQSTRAQAKLIDDILDVSRISTGKLQLSLAPVSLEDIVRVAVSTIRQLAEAKAQIIDTRIEKLRGCVIGDSDRLGQIVRNLLSNAVKFTPTGGTIRIELDQVNFSTARILVSDTGEGIAPNFLPFVFERFRQAQTGLARTHGGLGLGLSIVKDLAELHGGSVSVTSDGVGKGASFTVMLPLVDRDLANTPLPSQGRELVALHGIRVLIVEDDEPTRTMLRTALARFGAAVSTAGSVAEAMFILANDPRSVVISDIAMPEEDGYSLIARLHEVRNGSRRNPIIALTANARAEDRERAIAAGFDAFLAKPVDLQSLAEEVQRLATLHSSFRDAEVP